MLVGFKYRLYPNKTQSTQINKNLGCYRFVYNYYLNKRIESYKNNITLSLYDCIKDLVNLKEIHPWLKEVDSNSLQQSLLDLDKAYQNFFNRIKKGSKELGFPKFKAKHDNYQTYRTQFINNNIQIKNGKIKIPKLKFVKFDNHRQFNGQIRNVTISRTYTGKYFVSCLVKTEIKQLSQTDKQIGIDLGLKTFATCSDGLVVENPKHLKKSEKRLAFLLQKLSRTKKGSNNRNKARIKVAKLYEKITNQRKDFLHKLSSKLINENQVIKIEDLNIKQMLQTKNLAKSISDCSWYSFKSMLDYKANWYGRKIKIVNRFFPSSQLCNVCGFKNIDLKDLSIRKWICPKCCSNHDRDLNAAINILKEG